jgi:dihydroorotase
MLLIKNVQDITGKVQQIEIDSTNTQEIDGAGLTLLPAVIDPHVHFRTPGMEYKEDWRTGARSALRGGCTTVFDMPNTVPPTITSELLSEKQQLIDAQLKAANIPLRYALFFGADKHHLSEISKVKDHIIGIKVFMGCSTGNLVIDNDESLHAVFEIAAQHDLLVAVHAEDEELMRMKRKNYQGPMTYAAHSVLRDIEVATAAVTKAISLSKQYGTRLYILHVSSAEEIVLISDAKKAGLPVYAETTPHHLFFDTSIYEHLNGRAVVNPPLRAASHRTNLFDAIHAGIIDTIGSDHAPHTIEEKEREYGHCPSGMPGIEFILPLLLNAASQKLLSLEQVTALTSRRAREIFRLPYNEDIVLVDLKKTMTVEKTYSKCQWTPYQGLTLQGWPIYTILNGQLFECE